MHVLATIIVRIIFAVYCWNLTAGVLLLLSLNNFAICVQTVGIIYLRLTGLRAIFRRKCTLRMRLLLCCCNSWLFEESLFLFFGLWRYILLIRLLMFLRQLQLHLLHLMQSLHERRHSDFRIIVLQFTLLSCLFRLSLFS